MRHSPLTTLLLGPGNNGGRVKPGGAPCLFTGGGRLNPGGGGGGGSFIVHVFYLTTNELKPTRT